MKVTQPALETSEVPLIVSPLTFRIVLGRRLPQPPMTKYSFVATQHVISLAYVRLELDVGSIDASTKSK